MEINTKNLKTGHPTINGIPVFPGMTVHDLSNILKDKMYHHDNYEKYMNHFVCTLQENDIPVDMFISVEEEKIERISLKYICQLNYDNCRSFISSWIKERDLNWYGENIYSTRFGGVEISMYNSFGEIKLNMEVELNYNKLRQRIFPKFIEDKTRSISFSKNGITYKVQRLLQTEEDDFHVINTLSETPVTLEYDKKWSKNNRLEKIYFAIARERENKKEEVIGVVDFTYMAVLNAYKEDDLFFTLDNLSESTSIIASFLENDEITLDEFSPYILEYKGITDELPYNKNLKDFLENDENMSEIMKAAIALTSKYVNIPRKNITVVSVCRNMLNFLPYSAFCCNVYVNFGKYNDIKQLIKK